MEHSPERDEEVFEAIRHASNTNSPIPHKLALELLAITKKWRSKALMRGVRIEELEAELAKDSH